MVTRDEWSRCKSSQADAQKRCDEKYGSCNISFIMCPLPDDWKGSIGETNWNDEIKKLNNPTPRGCPNCATPPCPPGQEKLGGDACGCGSKCNPVLYHPSIIGGYIPPQPKCGAGGQPPCPPSPPISTNYDITTSDFFKTSKRLSPPTTPGFNRFIASTVGGTNAPINYTKSRTITLRKKKNAKPSTKKCKCKKPVGKKLIKKCKCKKPIKKSKK